MLDEPTFRSLEGKSKHQLWLELADMVTRHPKEVRAPLMQGRAACRTAGGSPHGGPRAALLAKQPSRPPAPAPGMPCLHR